MKDKLLDLEKGACRLAGQGVGAPAPSDSRSEQC